ncbi:hypothetical protein BGX38DRAFT_584053 [Terfezia claveryi]|nr:hypothetical protein BGX38DRAFT_584053 [Terfezia claveryi]
MALPEALTGTSRDQNLTGRAHVWQYPLALAITKYPAETVRGAWYYSKAHGYSRARLTRDTLIFGTYTLTAALHVDRPNSSKQLSAGETRERPEPERRNTPPLKQRSAHPSVSGHLRNEKLGLSLIDLWPPFLLWSISIPGSLVSIPGQAR